MKLQYFTQWRVTTTKASSHESKDVTVFEKPIWRLKWRLKSYGYGCGKYKPGNLVQQSEISLCSSSGESKTHTSLHKKLILCNKNSKLQLAGRLKTL